MDKMETSDRMIRLTNQDWFDGYTDLEPRSIQLILTSPPFGIFGNEIKSLSWDQEIDIPLLEKTYDRVLDTKGQIILFCDLRLMLRLLDSFEMFDLRTYHIHRKTVPMPSNQYYPLRETDFVLVFKRKETRISELAWFPKAANCGRPYFRENHSKSVPTRRQKKSKITENLDGQRWIKTCITGLSKCSMKAEERSSHCCQISESTLRVLIKTYSKQSDKILDNYAGCGSTLVSAWREGRRSIGFEIEKDYYTEAAQRIQLITRQQNLFKYGNENQKQEAIYGSN